MAERTTPEKALTTWMDEHGCSLSGATPSMLVTVVRNSLAAEVRALVETAVAYSDWDEGVLCAVERLRGSSE